MFLSNITKADEVFVDRLGMTEAAANISPSVIIVDDAPDLCMVLKRTLEICDCDVIATAHNGDKAIALINEHKPDMLFLDIEMPIKNGFEVLDYIKEHNIPVCTIMLSGHSSKHNLVSAIKRGAQGFLVKPHTPEKVQDVVASYIKSRMEK